MCKDEKLKKILTVCLNVFSVLSIVVVCFARLYVGAHYLTDVLFGSGITLVSIFISEIIVKSLAKKIKLL